MNSLLIFVAALVVCVTSLPYTPPSQQTVQHPVVDDASIPTPPGVVGVVGIHGVGDIGESIYRMGEKSSRKNDPFSIELAEVYKRLGELAIAAGDTVVAGVVGDTVSTLGKAVAADKDSIIAPVGEIVKSLGNDQ